jgi:DNA-binding CsgD family transcriptional regulator/PAS domain-containing protein
LFTRRGYIPDWTIDFPEDFDSSSPNTQTLCTAVRENLATTTSFAAVSELVRKLYAGVTEAQPWESFLHGIRRETGCKAAIIMLLPPGSPVINMISVIGGRPEVTKAYRRELFTLDPFVNLPEGQAITLHEFVGSRKLERDSYYNRFMRTAWGIGFVLGADVRTAAGYTAGLRLCRGVGTSNFKADAHQLVEGLLPHLRQVIEIFDRMHRLQVEEAELSAAIDRLGVASFLLDAKQRVTQPNRSAETLFSAGAGLVVRNERLVLAGEDAQRRLAGILVRARDSTRSQNAAAECLPEMIMISRRSAGLPALVIAVHPLRSPAGLRSDHTPIVAVYVSAPEQRNAVPATIIRQLLGVTPAEAELAARLARGDTIDAAACELGVTRATARTQLYSIFRKTGLHRQSELVSVIAQTSARMPRE